MLININSEEEEVKLMKQKLKKKRFHTHTIRKAIYIGKVKKKRNIEYITT